ncbi:hypothetical protein BOTNAR_0277g00030 [Botryotinia narcissicola]|uniref:Uncharacterized protein n=1 Tax=Botryotinia narcissicola TaxID=278944 RepID=A0A4Z1HXV2_9HELO|nr:hypothetical protein BOTNAR_0277g00030 [Botryotinia narcissicola]
MPENKTSASRSSSTDSKHISKKYVIVRDPNGEEVSSPSVYDSGKLTPKKEGGKTSKKTGGNNKYLTGQK